MLVGCVVDDTTVEEERSGEEETEENETTAGEGEDAEANAAGAADAAADTGSSLFSLLLCAAAFALSRRILSIARRKLFIQS